MMAPSATALTPGTSVFPAVTGGFQIDGNLDASVYGGANGAGSVDWNSASVLPQPFGTDPIGTADATVFSGGSKENAYNDWEMNTHAGAPSKSDVGNYYFHSAVYDVPGDTAPHLFLYFGFERVDNTGSVFYNIELNQKTTTHENANGVTVPDRTAGDLLIALSDHGSQSLTFHGVVSTWTCPTPQTCAWSDPVAIPDAAISGLVNDSAVPDPFASAIADNGILDKEQFAEIGIDLSALFTDQQFVLGCPSSPVFGQISMRSRSSEELNSELKDMIGPLPVHLRDLCGDIRIVKTDGADAMVPGATFVISPNPNTGTGSLTAVDGGTNDLTAQGAQAAADGVVEFFAAKPGTYTVTEAAPPPGWIGDATPQTKQVDAEVVTTFTFENHLGTATWQKVDADTGEHLGGATFVVHRTSGGGTQPDVTVTDNGANDTDNALGVLKVVGLKTGTYTVTETVAPDGYNLPSISVKNFTISAENPNATVETPFRDPRQVGYLHIVKKLVDENGEPFTLADLTTLDGAVFVVYRDANHNGVLDAGEEAHLWASSDVATCTIAGGTGACDVGPLTLGDYRVAEPIAPTFSNSLGDVDVTVTESSAEEPIVVNYTNRLTPLAITLDKSSAQTLAHVGDTITYTFKVTNSGSTDFVNVTLVDPICDNGTLTLTDKADGDTVLKVGETWTYACTHVVLATDPDPLTNTATVTGIDARGRTATDTDDYVVDLIHPAITVVKTADNLTPTVGDTVTFTYVVTNTGDTTLYNVTVTDDILGAIGTVATLEPGASHTLTATEAVTADTPATNVGTAKGTDILQKEVSDTDTQTLTITAVTPPTPPTPVSPTNESNPPPPATGASVAQPTAWALGLMMVGALSIATSRRRRLTDAPVTPRPDGDSDR